MQKLSIVAVVLAALVATGCGDSKDSSSGGSSGSSSSGGSGSSQKSPEEAFKEFKAAGEKGDAKAMWNAMSKKTKTKMTEIFKGQIAEINKKGDEEWEEAAKDLGKPAAELKKMSAEEFAELAMAKRMTDPSEIEKAKKVVMDKVEMRGEIAVVFTTKGDGRKDLGALVKEDGTWKIDMEETEKLREEKSKLNEKK